MRNNRIHAQVNRVRWLIALVIIMLITTAVVNEMRESDGTGGFGGERAESNTE